MSVSPHFIASVGWSPDHAITASGGPDWRAVYHPFVALYHGTDLYTCILFIIRNVHSIPEINAICFSPPAYLA